ncbi:hypothetical protein [Paenibacillus xylanilyticus]
MPVTTMRPGCGTLAILIHATEAAGPTPPIIAFMKDYTEYS